MSFGGNIIMRSHSFPPLIYSYLMHFFDQLSPSLICKFNFWLLFREYFYCIFLQRTFYIIFFKNHKFKEHRIFFRMTVNLLGSIFSFFNSDIKKQATDCCLSTYVSNLLKKGRQQLAILTGKVFPSGVSS